MPSSWGETRYRLLKSLRSLDFGSQRRRKASDEEARLGILPPPELHRPSSSLRAADEYDKAATLVCDALEGVIHKQPLETELATLAYHVHLQIVLIVKDLLVPALLLMTFFERPWWCSGAECECTWDPEDPFACPTPTFDVWYLSDSARAWFEAFVLAAAFAHQCVLRVALGPTNYWLEDGHVFVALVGAIAANSLYATSWFRVLLGDAVVLPYLRLLVYVAYSTDVQSQLRLVHRIMPHYLRVGSLIALLVLCFAWAAVVIFPNTVDGPPSPYSEGDTYFSNLREGMWHMFILITTSNNPDVWAPAYTKNRWSCAMFIIFLLVGFFFLTNLLLATVYNVYNEEQDKLEAEAQANREKNLRRAFEMLTGPARDYIDTPSIRGLFGELNQHREVMYINDVRSELLLNALDHASESRIDFDDFVKLCSVLQLDMKRPTTVRGNRGRLKRLVTSRKFEYFIDLLLVLNCVVVAVQTRDELYGVNPSADEASTGYIWAVVETGFAGVYALEMIAKFYALGLREYFRLKSNAFDCIVTTSSVATVAVVFYPNAYNDPVLIKIVLMIRLARLLRLLVHVPEFQVIGESFFNMWAAAVKLIKLLFCVCYTFALIGMALYGGKINTDPNRPEYDKLVKSDYYASLYTTLNFNDMWSAFVLLFSILVVNNWWVLADGFIAVAGPSARIFFITFYCIGNLIGVNVRLNCSSHNKATTSCARADLHSLHPRRLHLTVRKNQEGACGGGKGPAGRRPSRRRSRRPCRYLGDQGTCCANSSMAFCRAGNPDHACAATPLSLHSRVNLVGLRNATAAADATEAHPQERYLHSNHLQADHWMDRRMYAIA